jgi:hypothetical protein
MPLSRRYTPEHQQSEICPFGFDFSPIIPVGVGITAGSLNIYTNTNPPVAANADWTVGPVSWLDRTLYATLTGGQDGVDYLLQWTADDTDGNRWSRFALVLVAATS